MELANLTLDEIRDRAENSTDGRVTQYWAEVSK